MNIDGLSEMTLEKFLAQGFLHEFADIYKLQQYKGQIVEMEGFGEKSYNNLIDSVEASRETTLPRVLYALGITGIGVATAKVLSRHFDYSLDKLMQADVEQLSEVEGIGEVIATAFADYMQNPQNIQQIKNLMAEVKLEEAAAVETDSPISGKSFCITGSLNYYANRNELKDIIEQKGGKVTGSVTSKTACLINNDITSNSSKNKKAKELGVPILTEEDFQNQYLS